ncbi:MAG: hypothetical protein GX119_10780 [Syntrophomonadaceae bacterium]|nr:hypothetical protein [Syntrophomonadaceae bacterium]
MINKKLFKIVLPILIVILAFGLAFDSLHDMYIKSRLEAQVELNRALAGTEKITDYRYSLKSGFIVEGREEVISQVQGEKSQGKTHIKGEMVNTAIDIYYINRTIYNYDSAAEKWLVIESDSSNSEELLISELNPLSNFRIRAPARVEKVGFEKINGTECLVATCETGVRSELLETFWQDFKYKFWIDYQKGLIQKAQLEARNKDSFETLLKIEVVFQDMNKEISIEAPDLTKGKE